MERDYRIYPRLESGRESVPIADRGRNGNGVSNGARYRAVVGMKAQHSLHDLTMGLLDVREVVGHMNLCDDENAPIFLDFTDGFGYQISATRIDAARLQRASKGPSQSTARRGHYVVKCGGIGWVLIG